MTGQGAHLNRRSTAFFLLPIHGQAGSTSAYLNRRSATAAVYHDASKGVAVTPQVKEGAAVESCSSRSLGLELEARSVDLDLPACVVAIADCNSVAIRRQGEKNPQFIRVRNAGIFPGGARRNVWSWVEVHAMEGGCVVTEDVTKPKRQKQ